MISDKENKTTVVKIIRREIEIEDDMLRLYAGILKKEELLTKMKADDKDLAEGILNILLTDTARHKKTMEGIIKRL